MAFRAFIAVEMGRHSELESFSRAVESTGAHLKMVNLKNLHVTLKFLGDVDEALVPEIRGAMESAVDGQSPFQLRLRGAGAFPNLGRISVVWAGLEDAGPLVDIAGKLDAGLSGLGFRKERRPFSPHVTVARVKSGKNRDAVADVIRGHEGAEFGTVDVDRIILKKSVLTPRGPIYSDVEVAEL